MSLSGRYLTFRLGGQVWGLRIEQVREIIAPLDVTPVPGAPAGVLGAFNLRGRVLPLLDPRQALGSAPSEDSETTVYIVLDGDHDGDDVRFAVHVDAVDDVLELSDDDCAPPPQLPGGPLPLLEGVGRDADELVLLVNLGRLLAA